MLKRLHGDDLVRDRGLSDKGGRIAAKKVREFAVTVGYDLSEHRSAHVTGDDYAWADIVVYMDGGNLRRIPADVQRRAVCLAQYVGQDRIPDPNYMPRGDRLDAVLTTVVEAATILAKRLAQQKTPVG